MELFALCQILPGPTSTQTITALGYKIGGSKLAYLTLLVWVFPAVILMMAAALTVDILNDQSISLEFLRYVQPMAVGIVAYSAYRISISVVSSIDGYFLMALAAVCSFYLRSPYAFPVLLFLGGFITAFKYKQQPKSEKLSLKINWAHFLAWAGVLLWPASLAHFSVSYPLRFSKIFIGMGL